MGVSKNLLLSFLIAILVSLFYILLSGLGVMYMFNDFSRGEFMIFNFVITLIVYVWVNELEGNN